MSEYRTAQQHLDAFRDAMAIAGVAMANNETVVADGKLHRYQVDTDRRGRRNGWYVFYEDGIPSGGFGRWGSKKWTWTADKDTVKPLTREERDELARKREERKAREAAERAAAEGHAATRSAEMWDRAAPAETHPYLTRKGIKGHGVRVGEFWKENKEGKAYRVARDALLIKMRDDDGNVVGLQAIYAQAITVGEETRDKDFVFGARKQGVWATIGAPTEIAGRVTVGICEGYATGASAHEAVGLGVVVAFDAGNLVHVAREVRKLLPDARLVILADNDQWTTRNDGSAWNPGLEKGRDAAQTVDALLVAPEFADVEAKPTDWNDLHQLEGLPQVRRQIMAAIAPEPEPAPEPESPPPEEPPPADPEPSHEPDQDIRPPDPPEEEDELSENPYFRVCGHDRTHIFVLQHEMKMVVSRGNADWGEAALTSIAPLHWWEVNFPGEKGFSKKSALNWLQRTAFKRGFFDPESLRGRGAWRDDGRFVYHFGHKLWVGGELVEVHQIDSTYIYEQGRRLRLPADAPMSSAEGKALFEAFQLFSWSRPASAILLAGWCSLAMVGGALRWRPHVWTTGGAGSGKTTILNFVHWLMNGVDLYAQGNSTEAGIRQTLRTDSRPVLFDESEQNNERETLRMQNVLSLIRQSSTESDAQTLKGTAGGDAMNFVIRSMFCLGSIQVGLKQQADAERISVLSLKPKKDGPAEEAQASDRWRKISGGLAALMADQQLPAKLLHRALRLLPITVQNVEIFAQAAAERFGSQRDGDQYGTLLAGAWSLVSAKVATLDEARAMIDRYDWSDYLEASETEESDKAMATLMGRLVKVGSANVSIYELLARSAGVDSECGVGRKEAGNVLRRHGLMIRWGESSYVDDAHLLIANKHPELDRLMEDTPYAADLKGQLLRLSGAQRHDQSERFLGVVARCIRLPLASVLGCDAQGAGAPDTRVDDDIAF